MGKSNSKQAWMSREGPEGDCVIENDTTNTTLDFPEDGVVPDKTIHTAEYTYKGYPVNLEVPYEYELGEKEASHRKGFFVDYPIEVVELPDVPDGKRYDDEFKREGVVEVATQTKPSKKVCYFVRYLDNLWVPELIKSVEGLNLVSYEELFIGTVNGTENELAECGLSVKSTASEQEWSYTLYNFEGKGQVTRDDIKNLVKSIYEVLGKNIKDSRNSQRDPLKKLRVRLSVSKEHGKDNSDGISTRREYVLSASGSQMPKRVRAKSLPIERGDSLKVNPPTSSDGLNNPPERQSRLMCDPPVGMESFENNTTVAPRRQKSTCKRCEQRRAEKQCRHRERSSSNHKEGVPQATINSQGMYHYPKRLQTGPGDSDPTPGSNHRTDMSRVQEWIDQWCKPVDGEENIRVKDTHRHKQRSRHKVEMTCHQLRSSQYLDLAIDPLTSPYHVDDNSCTYLNPSPRPRRSTKHSSQHSSCKHHCKCQQEQQPSVVHRHEHHHHHSHHHYHHHVS